MQQENEDHCKKNLRTQALIDLSAETQPERVGKPDMVPEQDSTPSDRWGGQLWMQVRMRFRGKNQAETRISLQGLIKAFQQSQIHRLLILGEPGAGKTTLLLELTKALLQQAQQPDKTQIPVLLELSTWKDEQLSFPNWLVQQLKDKYNVPETVSRDWLQQRQLVPLLDGLDELGLDGQSRVISAINKFVASQSYPRLVVCCRQEEFEQGGEILPALEDAVYLKPLTDEQIRGFLKMVHRDYLWDLIHQSPDLRSLLNDPQPDGQPPGLRSPLLLTMLVIAYKGKDPIRNQQELFEAYVREQFRRYQRKHGSLSYSEDQTCQYLTWLARQLKAENRTELYIEDLQPWWLEHPLQLWTNHLILGLIGGLPFGLLFGLISGLLFGLLFGLQKTDIELRTRPNQAMWNSAKNFVALSLLTSPAGLLLFTVAGLGTGQTIDWHNASLYALTGGLLFGFFGGGGLPCSQHISLRLLLWLSGAAPRDYAAFLNYASELRLMHRVGGRYRFIHDLLREYFIRDQPLPTR